MFKFIPLLSNAIPYTLNCEALLVGFPSPLTNLTYSRETRIHESFTEWIVAIAHDRMPTP